MPEKPQTPDHEEWTQKEFLYDLGKRIHDLRKGAGMTQQELADRIGVSFQCISYAERGEREPKSTNLLKIANVLHVSTDYLLTGKLSVGDYVVISDKIKKVKLDHLQIMVKLIDRLAEK
ncbi:MAG: helix-turn-helix transcriptional regulator [Lachnospiraceae bacterium]|nr:helix-turn-helix transcriptional regulator [Lachnospiraceae bacterium]